MDNLLVNFDDIDNHTPKKELCQECQEFYIVKNNKCSKCLEEEYKCIQCKEYYTKGKNSKCSCCKLYNQHDVNKMTLNDIINLPTSPFKSEMMTANLAELYNDYKNRLHLRHKLLTNPTEFNLLKNLCQGKNSGEVFVILDGLREFPAVILPASYANQLLDEIVKGPDDKWRYEHAISSFVLDIWNMNDGHIINCYYKDTGNITKCPQNIVKLYQLWYRIVKNEFSRRNLPRTLILTCPESHMKVKIYTDNKLIICKHCCNYNPIFNADDEQLIPYECMHCVKLFNKENEDYIIS